MSHTSTLEKFMPKTLRRWSTHQLTDHLTDPTVPPIYNMPFKQILTQALIPHCLSNIPHYSIPLIKSTHNLLHSQTLRQAISTDKHNQNDNLQGQLTKLFSVYKIPLSKLYKSITLCNSELLQSQSNYVITSFRSGFMSILTHDIHLEFVYLIMKRAKMLVSVT